MTATVTTLDVGQALADILEHGEDARAIQDQARQVGGCEHPIRLRGRIDTVDRATGELEQRWSTETMADGVVHTRCNNRRASRCEPCSRLYQQDTWGSSSWPAWPAARAYPTRWPAIRRCS
ncbi:MAG: replication initiator [Egibacteraceae bacterium]